MNDIPDWAGKRACELLNADCGMEYYTWPCDLGINSVRTVAKLVMQHETAPVDPDEEAVKRIFQSTTIYGDVDEFFLMRPEALARAVSQYKQEKANG